MLRLLELGTPPISDELVASSLPLDAVLSTILLKSHELAPLALVDWSTDYDRTEVGEK